MNDRKDEANLALEPIDALDSLILRALGDVFEHLDPPPEGLTDRIKFATTVHALEAEVAQLLRAPVDVAEVRAGSSAVETITFTSRHLTVMVSIAEAGHESVRVDGWVTGGGVRIELRTDQTTWETVADADGRFVFDGVPRGAAQFVLHRVLPDGTEESPVITPAVVL